jgi:hypothetical protein
LTNALADLEVRFGGRRKLRLGFELGWFEERGFIHCAKEF